MTPLDSEPGDRQIRVRSAFISDVHLGFRDCKADRLLGFLRLLRCERLFLVGDVIDLWSMRRHWYWPESHNTVVQKVLRIARRGTAVTYIPGNHDARFRQFEGLEFGGIRIVRDATLRLGDGRVAWVTHGDQFDAAVKFPGLLRNFGAHGYEFVLWANRYWNGWRRWRGLPHWSLAEFVKRRLDGARRYIERYEETVAAAAADRGVDVVVCGHIHRPATRRLHGIDYCNDGDWVENCTALVELADGRLELVDERGVTAAIT